MLKSGGSTLRALKKQCGRYLRCIDYVYKGCIFDDDPYLIVLKKRSKTKSNETRKNVTNSLYAEFRADTLDVIAIINICNPQQTKNVIIGKYKNIVTEYKVGRTVRSN